MRSCFMPLVKIFAAMVVMFILAPVHPAHADPGDYYSLGGGLCYDQDTYATVSCPVSGGGSDSGNGAAVLKAKAATSAVKSAGGQAISNAISSGGGSSSSSSSNNSSSGIVVNHCDSSSCYDDQGAVVGSCDSSTGYCVVGADKGANCDSSDCILPPDHRLDPKDKAYRTGYGQSADVVQGQAKHMVGVAKESNKMVLPPHIASLYDWGSGVSADYQHTTFSDGNSGLGSSRREQSFGATFRLGVDTDDWGLDIAMPIQRYTNNGVYSALNSTSIGWSILPTYHLLRESLHGVSLNVGAVFGYQHEWFNHLGDLTNPSGSFALTNFTNLNSIQLGGFFKAAKAVRPGLVLSLGAAYVDDRNFDNKAVMGRDNAVITADLGLLYIMGRQSVLTADVKSVNISQYTLGGAENYGEFDLGFKRALSKSIAVQVGFNRTFANPQWSATGGRVNLVMVW